MPDKYIHILDEKTQRQANLAPYLKELPFVKVISTLVPLTSIEVNTSFKDSSLICLHDSFFNSLAKDLQYNRNSIEQFTIENQIPLVVFGGGIVSIKNVSELLWFIPVSKFYKNLEFFYHSQLHNLIQDLNILAFGEGMKFEQVLSLRSRLTYLVNDINESEAVKLPNTILGELKAFTDLVSDSSLYDRLCGGEIITRETYLYNLEVIVQKIINGESTIS